jgi:hypothetical protein
MAKADAAAPLDETVRALRRPPRASAASRSERVAPPVPLAAAATPRKPELDATIPPRPATGGDASRGDLLLYLLLAALLGAAWQISRMGLLQSSDDASYWIGVAGGACMLALFVYPLRKYTRFMQGWGRVKAWFWIHLALGIFGPWLILCIRSSASDR